MSDLALLLPGSSGLRPFERPLRVLGIDLGTTNSTVAEIVWDPSRPGLPRARCVEIDQRTAEGLYTHVLVPSILAVHEGESLIGEGAKRRRAQAGELGLELYRDIFWETKNDMGVRRTYHKAPAGFRCARDIAAHLLRFLADGAAGSGRMPAARTVVTVPASFQTAQREDTRLAAERAGIPLAAGDLLDEPIAAFLDYLARHGAGALGGPGDKRNLLVFDFGGGTCDVAVFRIVVPVPGESLGVAPLAVSRYHRLGGGDIDAAIVYDCLLPQLIEQNHLESFDLGFQEKSRAIAPALLGVAEALKVGLCREIARRRGFGPAAGPDVAKTLSGEYPCRLRDGRVLTLRSPRLDAVAFTEILGPFLDRDLLYARQDEYRQSCSIFAPIEDALERAGLDPADIHFCLLAGGSSLIPQVAEALRARFASAKLLGLDDAGDSDATQTAVARGAAYQAFILARTGRGLVTSVAPDAIRLRTASGPIGLVARGALLPQPAGGGWSENRSLVIPAGSFLEPLLLRLDVVDSTERLLGHGAWRIPAPVERGEGLLLRHRLDENQTLHLRLSRASDPAGPPFDFALENPGTTVVNPATARQRIDAIEEDIRTGQVPASDLPEVTEEVADLYSELGQREKAFELLRGALREHARPVAGILNKMGTLRGAMADTEGETKYYREAARAAPAWGGPLFNLALAQRRQSKFAEAAASADAAIGRERSAPYLVLRALLADRLGDKTIKETRLREARELFGEPGGLADWELHWYVAGAEAEGDADRVATGRAELLRRRGEHEKKGNKVEEGYLPDLAPSVVKRPRP